MAGGAHGKAHGQRVIGFEKLLQHGGKEIAQKAGVDHGHDGDGNQTVMGFRHGGGDGHGDGLGQEGCGNSGVHTQKAAHHPNADDAGDHAGDAAGQHGDKVLFQKGDLVINAKGQAGMPRKKIDALVEFAKGYGAKGLAYLAINEDGTYKSSFAKFMTEEELAKLVEAMDGQPGDLLLFAADKNKVVWDVLGALRLELAKTMELIDNNKYNFLWVTEFPLLEWDEEEKRFVAVHHPFTMPMDEDIPYLDSDPGRVRAKAYDIVLNGTELGGGSVRIHQGDIQSKMFEMLGFTPEQAHSQFGFLLDAFKYGVPPHAGLAYGLDRMIMLMVKAESIRDVMAFPKVKDASCLMSEAPNVVDPKQLEELCIQVALPAGESTEE